MRWTTLVLGFLLTVSALAQDRVSFIATGDSRGGDNGVNSQILGEIAQAIVAEDVDFVIFAGDLVSGSSDSAMLAGELLYWRTIMQPVYDAGIAVYPCRGNHDAGNVGAWNEVFSGSYALPANGPPGEENLTFSFTYGNVFVAGLDQYVTVRRVNLTWLSQQFTANSAPHVFILGHEPAFSVDHSDCLDDYPAQRDSLWNMFAVAGGSFYFTGHDHFYNHARIDDGDGNPLNDLHQYLVGSAGAPLRNWDGLYNGNNGVWTPRLMYHESNYGYLRVEVSGTELIPTWMHRVAPGVFEPVHYSCGDADGDGVVTLTDAVFLVAYIFDRGPAPQPLLTADADCTQIVNISDAVYLIAHVFGVGTPPCAECP
jgi:hypothetical protein